MKWLTELWKQIVEWWEKLGDTQPTPTPIPIPTPTPTPTPTPKPTPTPVPTNKCRGIMATDWGCDSELWKKRKKDMKKWREVGINTIYVVGDLQCGSEGSRVYIVPGRSLTRVSDTFVKNCKIIADQGFRLIVALGNEPSVRSGRASALAGLGNRGLAVSSSWFYGPEHLENEKACWRDFLLKMDNVLWGAVPYLEPSVSKGAAFCIELSKYLRSIGYAGEILYNGYGDAGVSGDPLDSFGCHPAPRAFRSIADWNGWSTSTQWIRNGDGYRLAQGGLNAGTAAVDVPKMTTQPGPGGFVLWFNDYCGRGGQRVALADWHYKYVR